MRRQQRLHERRPFSRAHGDGVVEPRREHRERRHALRFLAVSLGLKRALRKGISEGLFVGSYGSKIVWGAFDDEDVPMASLRPLTVQLTIIPDNFKKARSNPSSRRRGGGDGLVRNSRRPA